MALEKVLTLGATGVEEKTIDTGGGGGGSRPTIASATTFYVATTGSDTTGDGSVGNPWQTIQFAFNTICSTYELRAIVTVKLADGTYTENVTINGHTNGSLGTPQLALLGHATDPTLTVINGSLTVLNLRVTVTRVKFVKTGSSAISSTGANILLSNCHIDQASTSAYTAVLTASMKGFIYISQGTWTLGTVEYLISAGLDSAVMVVTAPTLAGTPVWARAGFKPTYGSSIQCNGAFGGVAATGKKFEADSTSLVGVVANIPGNTAGTFDLLDPKQDLLVSGTNIKTVNGNSLLGSGNLVIAGGGSGDVVGPATATNNAVALFDGTTGELLKDSGAILQANVLDTTAGAILRQGAHGLGTPMVVSNLNTLAGTGFFQCGDVTGTPGASILGWWGYQQDAGPGFWKNQRIEQQGAPQNSYVRASNDGVTWGNWAYTGPVALCSPDTVCDLAMDGTTLINSFKPIFYEPAIGVAQLFTSGFDYLVAGATQYGNSSITRSQTGTGAASSLGIGEYSQNTGTTATGYTNINGLLTGDVTPPAYSFYDLPVPNAGIGSKLAASLTHYISAVSDATNTFSSTVTLLGPGPTTNAAPAITHVGFMLSYTHSVNSGNYVINYRGEDGALKTVNTTVAPGVGLANAKRIVAKAHRTAANTATVTINIGGTVYTITDSAFNAAAIYVVAGIGARIVKTAGTTARTQGIRHASAARNFV